MSVARARTAEALARALAEAKAAERHPVHGFHRYFGKLIPAIPAFAIREFTAPGDLVLDVFCGSGTTLVEARESGRGAVGLDRNPLATLVARVKTTRLDRVALLDTLDALLGPPAASDDLTAPYPYVVNMDHWFRPEVQIALLRLKTRIDGLPDDAVRDFFRATFSAFLRRVSNADPQHVFPGYSKRMRALDAAGRGIDVPEAFRRAVRKRADQVSTLREDAAPITCRTEDARSFAGMDGRFAAAVLNPPYISSIRYLETLKLEMGWLGLIETSAHYGQLDRQTLGTERFLRGELADVPHTGLDLLDGQIEALRRENPKMAKVVAEYFVGMDRTLAGVAAALRSGGVLTIKISDSRVRGQAIATHRHLTELGERHGLRTIAAFTDTFDPHSRSLHTARNVYSGIMTHDWILVLEK